MPATTPPPGHTLPIALAFVAGFVDTCGFVALFFLFSAHVTGNFVVLGASLVLPHAGVVAKLLALPVFILAVAGTRLYVLHFAGDERVERHVLAIELVFLGLFLVAGLASAPIVTADAPMAVLTGMLAVSAMGVQNAAARTVFASLSPTTVMTGNVTQVVLDCVDYRLSGDAQLRSGARARLAKFGPPVIGFAAGAVAGALLYRVAGFWCVVLPMVIIGGLLLRRSES
ncbi:MAG TPA: YoaK family protein [Steroidobacteraceae bacterium]